MDRDGITTAYNDADRCFLELEGRRGFGLHRMISEHVRLQLECLGCFEQNLHRFLTEESRRQCEYWLAESRKVLSELRPRYGLGIISNFHGNLEVVLQEQGLRGLLDIVVDSEVVSCSKPDSAIFRLAQAAAAVDGEASQDPVPKGDMTAGLV